MNDNFNYDINNININYNNNNNNNNFNINNNNNNINNNNNNNNNIINNNNNIINNNNLSTDKNEKKIFMLKKKKENFFKFFFDYKKKIKILDEFEKNKIIKKKQQRKKKENITKENEIQKINVITNLINLNLQSIKEIEKNIEKKIKKKKEKEKNLKINKVNDENLKNSLFIIKKEINNLQENKKEKFKIINYFLNFLKSKKTITTIYKKKKILKEINNIHKAFERYEENEKTKTFFFNSKYFKNNKYKFFHYQYCSKCKCCVSRDFNSTVIYGFIVYCLFYYGIRPIPSYKYN